MRSIRRSPYAAELLRLNGFEPPYHLDLPASPRPYVARTVFPTAQELTESRVNLHFRQLKSIQRSPGGNDLIALCGHDGPTVVPPTSPRSSSCGYPGTWSTDSSRRPSSNSMESTASRRKVRSRASKRASLDRRRRWLQWRSQQHDDRPDDGIIMAYCRLVQTSWPCKHTTGSLAPQ